LYKKLTQTQYIFTIIGKRKYRWRILKPSVVGQCPPFTAIGGHCPPLPASPVSPILHWVMVYRIVSWNGNRTASQVFRLRDRVSPRSLNVGQVGTIKGFKMLDGSNVGIVVQFEDKFATWFFEDELKTVS